MPPLPGENEAPNRDENQTFKTATGRRVPLTKLLDISAKENIPAPTHRAEKGML